MTGEAVVPPPEAVDLVWHILSDIEGISRYFAWRSPHWLWPSTAPFCEQPLEPEEMALMGYSYCRPVDFDIQKG